MSHGGGLTRSPVACCYNSFTTNIKAFQDRKLRYSIGMIISSLITLFIIQNVFYLAISIMIMLLFLAAIELIAGTSLVAVSVLVLSAPWWATVIKLHGLEVFLRVRHLSNSSITGILALVTNPTNETVLAVCALMALLGIIVELKGQRYWLPFWVLMVFLLHNRCPQKEAVIPISILAGIVNEVLVLY